ncbi:zf-CGNR multi-domain protein [Flavobacterium cupreum]|uniref:Zf-CGNR multi-domain protein n=1 Tax=Flavobacterium cupreum TaxID=2133766 RepID=A0A434ADK5_9FLAO|nr:CGNR zinc finger domain-containing protein [Flavobacterium cupreum]RUT72451.1 zf-CGNR multi-domain protein [Flavobacterium cupreum]
MKNDVFIHNELRLDGNHLCLNFINTIFDRTVANPVSLILSKEDWIAWLLKVDLIKKNDLDQTEILFDLDEIVETRTILFTIFYGLSKKETISRGDLNLFEKLILKVQKATKLQADHGIPAEILQINNSNLNDYLLPIIKSGYELFLSGQIHRIKECGHCGWLYLDNSKNNSRKWCSMETCGSQIKAKRYYQNKKSQTASGQ